MFPLLYILGAVVLAAAAAIAIIKVRRARRESQISRIASSLGFTYAADAGALLQEGLAGFPVFALAHLPEQTRLCNLLRKPLPEGELCLCDYHYWFGSGGAARRLEYSQTVACVARQAGALPSFAVHEKLSDQERQALRGVPLQHLFPKLPPDTPARRDLRDAVSVIRNPADDRAIALEGYPEFNRRYSLRSPEGGPQLTALFRPELIAMLERQTQPLRIEALGKWMVIYRRGVLVDPSEIAAFAEEAIRVAGMFG